MDEIRKRAYHVLLSAAMLHLKWDLVCWYGGIEPLEAELQADAARRASRRAVAFHNLAISASNDFAGFSEEAFWQELEKFRCEFPDAVCPYRQIFERSLRGDSVSIIAPSGIGSTG
jgi:hypothetical protein